MSAYQVVAQNFSEDHENKIHSDEIAKKYGFKGGLVPGVAVWGHLTHPLVERLGEDWLAGSVSNVRFFKPAYHGDQLAITCSRRGVQRRTARGIRSFRPVRIRATFQQQQDHATCRGGHRTV